MSRPLTCIHRSKGLCPECRTEFEADPCAWYEFGNHPQGIANWQALQNEIAQDWAAEQARLDAEPAAMEANQDAAPKDAWDEIPF